jgi:hypothetical protein
MLRVMIRCPNTGQSVYTGRDISQLAFEDPTDVWEPEVLTCPCCQQQHSWTKPDAFLESE